MFTDPQSMFEKGSLAGKITPAVVVNNNDPTKNQRVMYRIATMHTGRKDDELVWAIPLGWSTQGNGGGVGDVSVPLIGQKILIFFPENDEHDTYYFADYHDKSSQIIELLEDYPHCYGRVDASGNLFLVNTLHDTVKFIHLSGSYIKFNQDGSGEVGFAKGFNVFAHEAIGIRSGVAISMDAPAIHLNEGGSATLTTTARVKPPAGNFTNKTDY
jgi:Type VI secretion system/phage-baseplate injector OB domain